MADQELQFAQVEGADVEPRLPRFQDAGLGIRFAFIFDGDEYQRNGLVFLEGDDFPQGWVRWRRGDATRGAFTYMIDETWLDLLQYFQDAGNADEGEGELVPEDELGAYVEDRKEGFILDGDVHDIIPRTVLDGNNNVPAGVDPDVEPYTDELMNILKEFDGMDAELLDIAEEKGMTLVGLIPRGGGRDLFENEDALRVLQVGRGGAIIDPETGERIVDGFEAEQVLFRYGLQHDSPYILPYDHFPAFLPEAPQGTHAPNCVLNYLIERYHVQAAGTKKISVKMIERHLGQDPTIESLRGFCAHYDIGLKLFDLGGRTVVERSPRGAKKGQRPAVIGIAFDHHLYPYTGEQGARAKIDFKMSPEQVARCNIPCWKDDSALEGEGDDALNDELLRGFLGLSKPNFFYASEDALTIKSPSLELVADLSPEEREGLFAVDLNKAYHTAATATDPQCGFAMGSDLIPCFSAIDQIAPYDGKAYRNEAYYFLTEAAAEAWRNSEVSFLCSRKNSLLHGFEARWLQRKGYLRPEDVGYMKLPSYTIPVKEFRRHLQEVSKKHPTLREGYSLLNGLLGKKGAKKRRVSVVGVKDRTEPDDGDLLALRGEVERRAVPHYAIEKVVATIRTRTHRYLNTRNYYNWVVARCNYVMMRFIHLVSQEVPTARVVRVNTDSVTFTHRFPFEDRLTRWVNYFKEEDIKYARRARRGGVRWIDAAEIQTAVEGEIKEFADKITGYTGPPGTGKTYEVTHNCEYDVAIAYTNTCARNLDTEDKNGQTIHSFMHLNDPDALPGLLKRARGKTIWLDEFSMVNAWIWNYFFIVVSRSAGTLICTGDPKQCPPFGERLPLDSPFFRAIVGRLEKLTHDHRNGPELVALRDKIDGMGYWAAVNEIGALAEKPAHAPGELSDYNVHVVLRNSTKAKINAHVLRKRGLTFDRGEVPAGVLKPRAKWTVSAMRLEARVTNHALNIYKGGRYELLADVTPATVNFTVRERFGNFPQDRTFPVYAMQYFGPGYAVTAESSQGITIREPFVIHEVRGMLWLEPAKFYTALTRGVSLADIRFEMRTSAALADIDVTELLWAETDQDKRYKSIADEIMAAEQQRKFVEKEVAKEEQLRLANEAFDELFGDEEPEPPKWPVDKRGAPRKPRRVIHRAAERAPPKHLAIDDDEEALADL